MTDPQPPWHAPHSRQATGCSTVVLLIVGVVMFLPSLCALVIIADDPTARLLDSQVAGLVLLYLVVGGSGVAMIWAVIKRQRGG